MPSNEDEEITPTLPRLSGWNPLDHCRLLWWVLVMPQHLKFYRTAYGSKAEEKVSRTLVRTLTWLPVLILGAAMGLGNLPHTGRGLSQAAYLWIGAGLFLAWILAGLFGAALGDWVTLAAGVATFVMALSLQGSTARLVALAAPILLALGVAGGVESELGSGATFHAALPFALAVACGLALGAGRGVPGITEALGRVIAAGVAALIIVGLEEAAVKVVAEDSVKIGRPSYLARGAFGMLLLTYAYLFWFCCMSGWQQFD
jgi:hypothetical protein